MVLLPNTIQPSKGSKKTSKRKGRGNASGVGNFSGRGMAGQRSRSGGKGGLKLMGFKQILKSTPKLRGFKSLKTKPVEIRLNDLEKYFKDGDVVNLDSLKLNKLVSKNEKAAKIILNGELKKKLVIEGIKITKGAREIVEKLGGEIK